MSKAVVGDLIFAWLHNVDPLWKFPLTKLSHRPGTGHNSDFRDSHEYMQKQKCGVSRFVQGIFYSNSAHPSHLQQLFTYECRPNLSCVAPVSWSVEESTVSSVWRGRLSQTHWPADWKFENIWHDTDMTLYPPLIGQILTHLASDWSDALISEKKRELVKLSDVSE